MEELNKEIEYIPGTNEDEIKTYEQEQGVLTSQYRSWQEDHQRRVREHLEVCDDIECIKAWAFYKSKEMYI